MIYKFTKVDVYSWLC